MKACENGEHEKQDDKVRENSEADLPSKRLGTKHHLVSLWTKQTDKNMVKKGTRPPLNTCFSCRLS